MHQLRWQQRQANKRQARNERENQNTQRSTELKNWKHVTVQVIVGKRDRTLISLFRNPPPKVALPCISSFFSIYLSSW